MSKKIHCEPKQGQQVVTLQERLEKDFDESDQCEQKEHCSYNYNPRDFSRFPGVLRN
jgi:hypothetical protein